MQIKHFTTLPKMPYFQFPRRPASAARKLLLIKAILSLVSYSLDKAFHLLPGFQAKLFFFCEIEWAVSHKLLTE